MSTIEEESIIGGYTPCPNSRCSGILIKREDKGFVCGTCKTIVEDIADYKEQTQKTLGQDLDQAE